jgi:hypothetical protein
MLEIDILTSIICEKINKFSKLQIIIEDYYLKKKKSIIKTIKI